MGGKSTKYKPLYYTKKRFRDTLHFNLIFNNYGPYRFHAFIKKSIVVGNIHQSEALLENNIVYHELPKE